jgi:hypothetical protein
VAEPRIVADDEVRAFIAEHGGNVYVWADDAGLKHVHLEPPEHPVEFESFDGDGFTLHQDLGIAEPPDEWELVLRHFPRKHVDALWGGWEPGITTPLDVDDV